MSDEPMKTTAEGERLIKDWQFAQTRLERTRQEVNSAECAVMNAANALGKWLMPPNATDGDKAAVWFHDSLVEGERKDIHTYVVRLRYRGKHWGQP